MTKREQKPGALTPGNNESNKINTIMSGVSIEIINAELLDDNFAGLIINGVPHLYWKEIYQKLGIRRNHAYAVLKRLEYRKHYVEYSVSEIKAIYTRVHKPCTLPTTTRYVFLTAEGYHRAILEIKTGYIVDPEVSEKIEELKDKMANIYTRYQKGEVLSIAAENDILETPKYVPASVVIQDYLEQAKLANQYFGVDLTYASSHLLGKASIDLRRLGHDGDISHFMALLPSVPQLSNQAYLNATLIGKEVGLSNRTVNNLLESLGYHTFSYRVSSSSGDKSKHWAPTEKGEPHGAWKMITVGHDTGSVHDGMKWYWKESIIDVIRAHLFGGASSPQQVIA